MIEGHGRAAQTQGACDIRAAHRGGGGRGSQPDRARRRRLHVQPLANSHAAYYPFLLVGVKVAAALALAALLARATRARAAAEPPSGSSPRSATATRARAAPAAASLVPGLARVVRRHLDRLPAARRHRGASPPDAGRSSLRGCTPTHFPSSRILSVARRVRVAARALAARHRGSRGAHVRARPPHPHRALSCHGPRASRPTDDTRAAPALRPRVRVAAASARRLTRGSVRGPAGRRLRSICEGGTWKHRSFVRIRRPHAAAQPRARHAVSLVGPATVAAAG